VKSVIREICVICGQSNRSHRSSPATRAKRTALGTRLASVVAAAALALAGSGLAEAGQRPNIRISLQLIEVPHPALTELLAGKASSGENLHTQAMALVHSGSATVLETCVLTSPGGQKATVESIREMIYPTEYEPPTLAGSPPPWMDPANRFAPAIRPDLFFAWETRNAGVSLEVEPSLAPDGKTVDLGFVPEIVDPVGLVTWVEYADEWGDCSTRMPIFDTLRTNTRLTLAPGHFELAAVLTPKPAAATPTALRKILVFVRADLPQQR